MGERMNSYPHPTNSSDQNENKDGSHKESKTAFLVKVKRWRLWSGENSTIFLIVSKGRLVALL